LAAFISDFMTFGIAAEYQEETMYNYESTAKRTEKQFQYARNFEWQGVRCGMALEEFQSKYPDAKADNSFSGQILPGAQVFRLTNLKKTFTYFEGAKVNGDVVYCFFWENKLAMFRVVSASSHRELWSTLMFELGSPTSWKLEKRRQSRFYWLIPESSFQCNLLVPELSGKEKGEVLEIFDTPLVIKYRLELVTEALDRVP